jgi:hypothetical protein
MGLSGLRVAEMCSLRVESLSQDGGYDSLKFVGKGGKPPTSRSRCPSCAPSASSSTAQR